MVNNPPVIEVQGLHKDYGKLAALQGINFTVNRGEIFGLIGPDGAGKTTTFQILAGVMEGTAGQVKVLEKPPREARLNIGYLTQKFSLYQDLSILENLRYSAGLRQVPQNKFTQRSTQLLKLFGLEQVPNRLVGKLSGGMKQKLALCCALISNPQVLLLDEPTTGVDPISRREFWDLLASVAAGGVTIVIATPYLDEAERCHHLALIHGGIIQQMGTLSELQDSLGLHRLEVRTQNLFKTEEVLHSVGEENKTTIVDIQFFGDRLDVLVSYPELAIEKIKEIMRQHQLKLDSLELARPTLENVFVTHLHQQGSRLNFIPFSHYKIKNKLSIIKEYRGNDSGENLAILAVKLQKNFGNFKAVKNVNIEVKYGEIYGLLGANGAGKTTTIKMLCGLVPASSGQIALAGETKKLDRPELRAKIGYMSQKFTLYDDLSIRQNLEFYCGVYGVPQKLRRAKINWVLETCGLVGQENTVTGKLPGGWKQRVAFGSSVMHEPEILFLDEPTSGVDPLARRQFWQLIRYFAQQGTAILVTTHYLEEAENCNRMGFMVAGELVTQGSPSQIKTQQPGQLIELAVDRVQTASNLLKTRLANWRVSIFGTRLHLVLDNPELELPQIRTILKENQIKINSERFLPFSLEDAFIGIIKRMEKPRKGTQILEE